MLSLFSLKSVCVCGGGGEEKEPILILERKLVHVRATSLLSEYVPLSV